MAIAVDPSREDALTMQKLALNRFAAILQIAGCAVLFVAVQCAVLAQDIGPPQVVNSSGTDESGIVPAKSRPSVPKLPEPKRAF